jgi:hypothetical protein
VHRQGRQKITVEGTRRNLDDMDGLARRIAYVR